MKVEYVAGEQLRNYIERIEALEVEKSEISSYVKDVFAEAKANGYDAKAIKDILKLRKLKAHERVEQEFMLDAYKKALGMSVED
jgi:uncharacterized protein (UPF0335 family)